MRRKTLPDPIPLKIRSPFSNFSTYWVYIAVGGHPDNTLTLPFHSYVATATLPEPPLAAPARADLVTAAE